MSEVSLVRDRYLDLLAKSLVDWWGIDSNDHRSRKINGTEWLPNDRLMTLVGIKRLSNIRACIETIINDEIPGDVIETGVWRGGACIFMRAVLDSYGDQRTVFLADSFAGIPSPDPAQYPVDDCAMGYGLHEETQLIVSVDEVLRNFRNYGVPTEQGLRIVRGWFRDTLPPLREEGNTFSMIRLDGDLYESTIVALENLYPCLSPGGFVVIDDYAVISLCAEAVHNFWKETGTPEVHHIDGSSICWRRP